MARPQAETQFYTSQLWDHVWDLAAPATVNPGFPVFFFVPTPAGKPRAEVVALIQHAVHPRVCGVARFVVVPVLPGRFIPAAAGSWSEESLPLPWHWFTPAYAGRLRSLARRAMSAPVYSTAFGGDAVWVVQPRMRGGSSRLLAGWSWRRRRPSAAVRFGSF